MKMNRMIAVLLLMLMLALCMVLTACGSDPVVAGDNPGAHEHAETPDTDTPGAEEEEAESVCLHKTTEVKDKKAATCVAQGYTGDKVCAECGKVMEAGSVTPIGGCDYEDTEEILGATCENVGVMLRICTICGDQRNFSIAALGHAIERVDAVEDTVLNVSHDDFHTEKCTREGCDYEAQVKHTGRTYPYAATCDYPAYKEGTCTVCRVKYRIYDANSAALGHAFDDEGWTETTAPTCQTAGEETRTCTHTGCTETETRPVEIDPDAHKWDEGTVNGDVIDYSCQNEGCEATKQESVEASGGETTGGETTGGETSDDEPQA